MDFSLVRGKCSVVCGDHVYSDMDTFFLEAQDRFYFIEVSVCMCVSECAPLCVCVCVCVCVHQGQCV